MKWGNSNFGTLAGIALVLLVLLGSCAYAAGACAMSGGNWNGDSVSCTHGGK